MNKQQQNIMIGAGVVIILAITATMVVSNNNKKDSNATMNASGQHAPAAPSVNDSNTKSTNNTAAVAATAVDIKDYMFAPMAIKVKVGDAVTWTNQDGVKHNVVADKPSADAPNGPLIAKGETYSFTFKKAGTYTYHCMPHTYMHGSVIVSQ